MCFSVFHRISGLHRWHDAATENQAQDHGQTDAEAPRRKVQPRSVTWEEVAVGPGDSLRKVLGSLTTSISTKGNLVQTCSFGILVPYHRKLLLLIIVGEYRHVSIDIPLRCYQIVGYKSHVGLYHLLADVHIIQYTTSSSYGTWPIHR